MPLPWMNDALRDILGGNASLWHELSHTTKHIIESIQEFVAIADENRIEFAEATDIKALHEDAQRLKVHMKNGGTLGWFIFRPRVVKERLYVINTVRINGRPCTKTEHFQILTDALHVRIEFGKAWEYWKGRSDKVEGPYNLQLSILKSFHDALETALSLEELIAKSRESINQCSGVVEPIWADEFHIDRIISSCRLALAIIRERLAYDEIIRFEAPTSRIAAMDNAHPITNQLLSAINTRDIGKFTSVTNRIHHLEKQRHNLHKMDEYFLKLRRLLPQLTDLLEMTCDEPYWDERLQWINQAWQWAQARFWIEDYIREEDLPALSARAKQIEDQINDIITKLASLYAWSFCFSRLKEDHRRHMEAWQQSMRRLGKGTGRHAPRHRREAQGHLNECREAVPAWVMPLHRVWDTVSPAPGIFDVIIVDEASQCGVEALPLFYLGKKILIVGDDKQISPDAVGYPAIQYFD
ncbi:hypothetical protein MASR1M66_23210 [Aminivibrio sp.]